MTKMNVFKDGAKAFTKGFVSQITGTNALIGMVGSAAKQIITEGEVKPDRMVSDAAKTMVVAGVVGGVVNVALNKDVIAQREDLRKEGIILED